MRNKVYEVQGKRQRNVPVSTQLNTGIPQNICIWFSSVKLRQNSRYWGTVNLLFLTRIKELVLEPMRFTVFYVSETLAPIVLTFLLPVLFL